MTTELVPTPVGEDLFELANAICACIDAPVTIENCDSRVLAFSARQAEADPIRIATVLGLQVPADHVAGAESREVLRHLAISRKACFFDPAALGGGHETQARAAVAVRAGDVLLGYIWAAVKEPLSPQLEEWLLRASDVVAIALHRLTTQSDRERQRVNELVSAVLAGGPEALGAFDELDLKSGPMMVLAMDLRLVSVDPKVERRARKLADLERLRSALRVHLSVTSSRALVADVEGRVFAMVSLPDPSGADVVWRHCQDFLAGSDPGHGAMIGVSNVALTTAELSRAWAEAQRALGVLLASPEEHPMAVARCRDVETDALLLELRRWCEESGIQPHGGFARLLEYDLSKRNNLLLTVQAWLDAHGDTVAAAETLFVHPNTFRYRLRRAAEVAGVDLDQPDERFALNLQLRLFRDRAGPR